MANEISFANVTGKTCYVLIRNGTNQIWNGGIFTTYVTANYTTYAITATEQGTASGVYTATMPSTAPAGIYSILAKEQAGGSPAETDQDVSAGDFFWGGSSVGVALGPTGLDAVLVESGIGASSALVNDSGTQLTSINARQALAACLSALAGALAGAATTNITIPPAALPAASPRVDATVDTNGNRSAVNLRVPD